MAASCLWAEINIEFVPERIEAGGRFTLSMVVPVREIPQGSNFPLLEDLTPFKLISTDSTDEMASGFFVRSQMMRKYRFHLQAPANAGTYQVGPLVWEVAGRRNVLGKVRVEVRRPFGASALTANLIPSKRQVFEGEQFHLTLTLQTHENFQGGIAPLDSDLGADFWSHRSGLKDLQFVRSEKPGVQMEATARYAWLSAIRSGNLQIPTMEFKYQRVGAPKVVEERRGNMSFRSVTQEPEEARTSTGAVSIQVMPLPPDKPEGFSGLVGQYSFSATVDRQELRVGDALALTIKIRGNGRPGTIPDPVLPDFSEFRQVPPESEIVRNIENGQVWTERRLRIFLYPRKRGEFTIAPIHFSWFDPQSRRYQTESSPAYIIRVERGEENLDEIPGQNQMVVGSEKREIEQLGTDIRHIHTRARLQDRGVFPYQKPLWWVLLLLPYPLAGLLFLGRRRHLQRLGNRALQRRTRARKGWEAHVRAAEAALRVQNTKQFYAEMEHGLIEWLSDICDLEFRGMLLAKVTSTLRARGLAEDTVEFVEGCLRACDYARFAPVDTPVATLEEQFRQWRALVDSMEKIL